MADDKEHTAALPQAIRSLIEARTGDAVFIIGPDYQIVYWDSEAESHGALVRRGSGQALL
jgi:hypothetical protein